jgi:alpha-galactosidase
VLFNDWEGCMFDFNHSKLVKLAKEAKSLGCELFVLDDGWFGKRNDDFAGLGDYNVNKKKLSRGLDGLADKIRSMGMEFGLWFEPESVNMDSDLYRAHPDWIISDDFAPLKGRNQFLLDLTKTEVRDYIVENVSEILDSANISYVKWDMNRHSVALGTKAYDYIIGLYDVLGRIFGPRPQILLESCSSGGNRFDLGMLCFGPQVWCSDNTDPIERITIQENLSYLYPQSTFGAHVSAAPHAQTLRNTPLCTRGNVSFFGCLGYELDLKHLLGIEKKQITEQIAFYKKYRRIFQFGKFSRLKNGWQVSDDKTVLAAVFRKVLPAAPGYEKLRLKNLDKAKVYNFSTFAQKLRVGQFGSLIKHVVPVNLDPNGFILRTADKLITLPDGNQELKASGAAFEAGIMLLPLFRGTGYDKEQRTLTDFGSELFIIEEAEK